MELGLRSIYQYRSRTVASAFTTCTNYSARRLALACNLCVCWSLVQPPLNHAGHVKEHVFVCGVKPCSLPVELNYLKFYYGVIQVIYCVTKVEILPVLGKRTQKQLQQTEEQSVAGSKYNNLLPTHTNTCLYTLISASHLFPSL